LSKDGVGLVLDLTSRSHMNTRTSSRYVQQTIKRKASPSTRRPAKSSTVLCCSTALLLLQACNRGSVSCDAMQKTLDVRHGLHAFPCSFDFPPWGREARQLKWSNHSRNSARPWRQYPGFMPWSSPAFFKPLRPSSGHRRGSSFPLPCFIKAIKLFLDMLHNYPDIMVVRKLPPSPPPK
jgi:hypothetical protein